MKEAKAQEVRQQSEDESSDEAQVRAEIVGAAPPAEPVTSPTSRKRKAPDEDAPNAPPTGQCDRCKTFKRGAECVVPPGEQKCEKCLAERHACYWSGVKYYGDRRVKRARNTQARETVSAPVRRLSPLVVSPTRKESLRKPGRPGRPATASDAPKRRRGRPPKNATAGPPPRARSTPAPQVNEVLSIVDASGQVQAIRAERAILATRIRLLRDLDDQLAARERELVGSGGL